MLGITISSHLEDRELFVKKIGYNTFSKCPIWLKSSKSFQCATLHVSLLLIISQTFFFQIISNHFELENVVKMTPKRRSFLPALFFTCFCITRPLLIFLYFCTYSLLLLFFSYSRSNLNRKENSTEIIVKGYLLKRQWTAGVQCALLSLSWCL